MIDRAGLIPIPDHPSYFESAEGLVFRQMSGGEIAPAPRQSQGEGEAA